MKAISKSFSYGYSKTVQLFAEDELFTLEEVVGDKSLFIVVITERGIDGELQKIAEYRHTDYVVAVKHLRRILMDFFNLDFGLID